MQKTKAVKHGLPFLLEQYQNMSGDHKIRIALSSSNMVRRIYQAGMNRVTRYHGN